MKKIHIYNITLTNGEFLKNIRVEGPLEVNLSGLAALIAVENEAKNTILLSKYTIVKAEMIHVENK